MSTVTVANFSNQDWAIAPLGNTFNLPPARSLADQLWAMTLSGVVIPNFKSGKSGAQWSYETIQFELDLRGPLTRGLTSCGLAIKPSQMGAFVADQWAPFATINSIYDQQNAVDAGFAADAWRPYFATVTDSATGKQFTNSFVGLEVDLAVRDSDAWIYRVGYNVTLIGKIVVATIPPIL